MRNQGVKQDKERETENEKQMKKTLKQNKKTGI